MKRWPIIRHVRYFLERNAMERWYSEWAKMGYLDVNRSSDEEVLLKIWNGEA